MNTLAAVNLSFLVFISSTIANSRNVLKISLYYDALCPYGSDFIRSQLYPTYKKIGPSLIIDLVPYGKANREKVGDHWDIYCQLGPLQCKLNKLTACGLSKAKNQDEKMAFVYCIARTRTASTAAGITRASKCAKKIGLSSAELLNCIRDKRRNELLVEYGEITDARLYHDLNMFLG